MKQTYTKVLGNERKKIQDLWNSGLAIRPNPQRCYGDLYDMQCNETGQFVKAVRRTEAWSIDGKEYRVIYWTDKREPATFELIEST